MAFFRTGGNNPAHGRDMGPPPPNGRQQGYNNNNNNPNNPYQPFTGFPGQAGPYGGGNGAAAFLHPFAAAAAAAAPRGTLGPVAPPVLHPAIPAANMTNSTGGVGCEPGYNYFFPAEHTKILVFRTGATPPWQLPPHFSAPFHAVHVPVHTTLGELLQGFGATNPNPQKNKMVELHQGGGGRWYKGMSFRGDKDKAMGKTLKSVGWDATRTGLPGGRPVVYLYVTKG